MADDKVQIVIEVDAKQAQDAIENFSKSSTKVISQTEKSVDSLSKSFAKAVGSPRELFENIVTNAGGALSAVALVAGAFKILKDSIKGAVEDAKLTRQIEASLLATDEASKQAVDSVIEFADAMKLATGVNDDLVKSTYVTAKSFGLTSEQAKKLTTAAIDLAAATGVDVETAVRQLGGTVDGTIGKIGNLGSEFRNLTESQLKSGAAIDLVNEKFGGSAAETVGSYEGHVNELSNAWEDFTKSIGHVIVDSGVLQTTLNFTTSILDNLLSKLEQYKSGKLVVTGANTVRGTGSMEDLALLKTELDALKDIDLGKTSQEIATGFQAILDTSVGATKATADLEDRLKSLIPNVLPQKIELTGKALEDFNKKAQDLLEAGKKFKAGILGSFGSQTETEAAKSKAAIDSVNKALMDGIISAKTAAEFRILINKDLNDKITKQNADANEKRQKQDEETAKKAKEAAKEAEDAVSKTSSQIGKVVGFAGQGKEGAKGAIGAGAGAAANAVLPGSGALVEQVVLLLASGKVAGAFVKEFIKAIPEIFLNIADAIPEILAGIIETVFTPEFLIRLGFAMGKAFIAVATLGLTNFAPEWGRKVGEEISKYVDFSAAAEKISAVFAEIGNTISTFFTGFADQLKSVFAPLIEPIQQLISALQSVAGQGGGQGKARDIGGAISDKFKSTFGLSKGGIVPLYAANGAFVPRGTDTVPAMLTPGERVLSVPTTNNLDTFMSSQSSGQEQTMAVLSAILQALQAPMVVNAEAKVNQSAFADIILQLNRQNMRLSA